QAAGARKAGNRPADDHPRTRVYLARANGPGRCEGIARAGPWSSPCGSRRPGCPQDRAARRSGAEAHAALGATARQDLAAVGRLHAGTEAVVALALEVAGLVGA